MTSRKEALFQQFYQITREALDANDPMQIAACLEKRHQLIFQIDELDRQSAVIEINEQIRTLIRQIQQLDIRLKEQMEQFKQEALAKLRAVKQGRMLQQQYQQRYVQTDGVFYDKRK